MKSYSERRMFNRHELSLLRKATKIVRAFPELTRDVLRCHEVARAVGQLLELPVQDGSYGAVEHSWLWTSKVGETFTHILDVYAVGRLPQVQLVDCWSMLPEAKAYRWKLGETRDDIRVSAVLKLVRSGRQSMRGKK